MKLNTLKPGKGFEKRIHWCGPAALALITGRTLKHCHRLLAQIRGIDQRYLKGVQNYEMKRALTRMGYMPTLRQWIEEDMKTRVWRGVVLVNVTNHYVVAHRGLVADNHWKEPVPPVVHHAGRKRVEQAWLITKI
jgi:hypothetical protein